MKQAIIKTYMLIISIFLFFILVASTEDSSISSSEAINTLKNGNERFVENKRLFKHIDYATIKENAEKGQHPFASILSCSDSRVPVEHIFDAGIGEVFVIRVAGNVADTDEIGTIEYGIEHLKTPLVVVLGHTKCGAVTAVVKGDKVEGSIPQLVDNIIPVIKKLSINGKAINDALIYDAVKENVWQSIEDLITRSKIARELIENKKVKVISAIYNIENKKVEWLGSHPKEEELLMSNTKIINKNNKIFQNAFNLCGLIFLYLLGFFLFLKANTFNSKINIKVRLILSFCIIIFLNFFSGYFNFYINKNNQINFILFEVIIIIISIFFAYLYGNNLISMFRKYINALKKRKETI